MEKENKNKFSGFSILVITLYLLPCLLIIAYYMGYLTLFRIAAIPIALMFVWGLYERFKTKDLRTLGILSTLIAVICVQIGYFMTGNLLDSLCMGCYLMMFYGAIETIYRIIRSKEAFGIILLFTFSLLTSLPANSQIVTRFSGEDALQTEDSEVYVEEVDLYSNYTYVKITIKPKHYISRLKIWTSPYTYLEAGYRTLKYLGALSNDGTSYHSLEYDDGYGWDNAYSSYKYSYTLVFEGSPSDGVKTISLIDPGVSYRGYTFRNIPINNREELPEPVYSGSSSTSSNSHYSYSNDWQKYIAYTTQRVNMRECSSTECDIIKILKQGSALFVDKNEEEDGFYKVLDIDSNEEGYVSKRYITFQKKVEQNKGEMFRPTKRVGYTYSPPTVNVKNNTNLTLTLVLNGTKYSFKPYGSQTITLQAITYDFRASAPGVIPLAGKKDFELGYDYDWEFRIVTSYR